MLWTQLILADASFLSQISFPFAEMVCDTGEPLEDACTKGRFSVAAFGALSRFSSDGTLQPVTSFKSGKQIGTSAPLTSLPGGDIYYGEQAQYTDCILQAKAYVARGADATANGVNA